MPITRAEFDRVAMHIQQGRFLEEKRIGEPTRQSYLGELGDKEVCLTREFRVGACLSRSAISVIDRGAGRSRLAVFEEVAVVDQSAPDEVISGRKHVYGDAAKGEQKFRELLGALSTLPTGRVCG